MIFDATWRLRRNFAAAARLAPKGPLADYYAAGLPDLHAADAPMAAIDLETDGLNAKNDPILEVGYVGMSAFMVDLSGALRLRIKPKSALRREAVVVHRITDDAIALAQTEAEAMATLLPRLAGRVLVAHFAQIEAAFLDAACQRIYGAPFVAPFICTFHLETRWFPTVRQNDQLRLGYLRAAYNLPLYTAHDGLIDAIACGELLLAQRARKGAGGVKIGDMLRR
jgi:DNA polymerase III subunit epsilon